MKHVTFLFTVLIIAVSTRTFGQSKIQRYSGIEASILIKGASHVYVNTSRNSVSFIRLNSDQLVQASSSIAWLKNDVLKATNDDDLKSYKQMKDANGDMHERYLQYYKNIPVEYGSYIVHSRNGRVRSANGEWYNIQKVNTIPKISAMEAYTSACNSIHASKWWHEAEETNNNILMLLPEGDQFKLVYKCDVYAKEPWIRQWVYVDALDGSIVKTENRIHNTDVPGTAITAYAGTQQIISDSFALNQFRLREHTHGAGVETYDGSEPNDFVNDSRDWDYGSSFDIYALDAHFGAEATYDFYDQNFDWQSVDGDGSQKLKSIVHGGFGINAFWDGTYMLYLDGDASMGVTPLTSLDICGHELTHGVTEHSSGLIYAGESGALNESFSDIAGATIRYLHFPESTWVLGDQFNYPIRDMEHPNLYECADTYGGDFWNNIGGDVHIRSGVQNFWFVLLVDGGNGVNDNGDSYYVKGIGLNDAYKIAMNNDIFYLTASSDFDEARDMSIQAAIDLYGDCSEQVIQTANAWYAVGVGDPYANAVSSIFVASQNGFCSAPAEVTFTNASENATSYSWDFGDGTFSTSSEATVTHTYAQAGNYTVSLTASGSTTCNTSNTLTLTNLINVDDIGATVPASCITSTVGSSGDYGTYRVKFNTIDHVTPNDDGYQDYTCSQFTYLTAGNDYQLEVWTNPELFSSSPQEDVRVWIDFNNDGTFDEVTELVFVSDKIVIHHTGTINTSGATVFNIPIRMRITDDNDNETISGSCYNPEKGQTEDYALVFVSADCIAPDVPVISATSGAICKGKSATLTISSGNLNSASNWQWYSTSCGGTPVGTGLSVSVSPTSTTSYFVRGEGGCVTPGDCATKKVKVKPTPTANVKATGDLDICTTGFVNLKANPGDDYSYQWNLDGVDIAGATNQNYHATQTGDYRVKVMNSAGCVQGSKKLTVYTSCKLESQVFDVNSSAMSVYPNPSDGKFIVSLDVNDESNPFAIVQVVNVLGQIVYNEKGQILNGALHKEIELSDGIAMGTYLVKIIVNNEMYSAQINYLK